MSEAFKAVRGLHLAEPTLSANKLHAKLKQQRPDLAVSASEVRAALRSLTKEAKAEAGAVEANRKRLRDALLGAGPSSDSSLA